MGGWYLVRVPAPYPSAIAFLLPGCAIFDSKFL